MKNQFTIPALWLLSAAGTFALGWAVKPGAPKGEQSEAPRSRLTARPGSAGLSLDKLPPGNSEAAASELGWGSALNHVESYVKGGAISADDMAAAIADMKKEDDPLKKQAMFSQLLTQLTPENAKSAYLALREGRGGDRRFGRGGGGGDEQRLLLNAWGRIDGAGAVAELKQMDEERRAAREAQGEGEGQRPGGGPGERGGPGGGFGDRGGSGFDIASVLNGWATADASGAMQYVNGIEDERAKGMLQGSVIRGVMVNGVDEAVALISSLPADDENRGRHMWAVAEEVLEDGAASAAQWLDTVADESLRGGAMARIAESFAREDLDGAIAWVGAHADQDYARSAATQVAERWAQTDPQAVIAWASQLPEGTQQGVFSEALDEWTERDALAASEYLAQMEASPVRDSAIQGFATQLAREDPLSAATWADSIGDEAQRIDTLTSVARDWMRSDRAAAEAWLPTSGLSEEQQQQVTQGGGRGFRGGQPGGGRGR